MKRVLSALLGLALLFGGTVGQALAASPTAGMPTLPTNDGRFIGAVSLHDVKPFLSDPALADLIIANEIMHEDFAFVDRDATLAVTMQAFLRQDSERLPVVDGHGGRMLIGSVSRTDLMLALSLGAHPRPEGGEAAK